MENLSRSKISSSNSSLLMRRMRAKFFTDFYSPPPTPLPFSLFSDNLGGLFFVGFPLVEALYRYTIPQAPLSWWKRTLGSGTLDLINFLLVRLEFILYWAISTGWSAMLTIKVNNVPILTAIKWAGLFSLSAGLIFC